MAKVLYLLERIADPTSTLNVIGHGALAEWEWETLVVSDSRVAITLSISDHGMRIHTRKESCLVGRETEIAATIAEIIKSGARVILHGYPGVGKDTVAREVVFAPEVSEQLGLKLQGWLQASTDAGFRSQLVQFFVRNRHEVLGGIPDTKQDEQLAAINAWLSHPDHRDEWLFVIEDASRDCKSLWEYIPTAGCGRLLITSQVALHESEPALPGAYLSILLQPFTPKESLYLWEKMGVFSSIAPDFKSSKKRFDQGELDEVGLQHLCTQTCGRLEYAPETSADTTIADRKERRNALRAAEQRRLRMFERLDDHNLEAQCASAAAAAASVGVSDPTLPKFRPPPTTRSERTAERKERHRAIWKAVCTHINLTNNNLAKFFHEDLGNLPLSVALCGQMFRASFPEIQTVDELITKVREVDVTDIDAKGYDGMTDTHYFGMAKTVRLAIFRLYSSAHGADPDVHVAALALLSVLARLPVNGSAASEMFKVSENEFGVNVNVMVAFVAVECPILCKTPGTDVTKYLPPSVITNLFRESMRSKVFAPACVLLEQYGLIRRGASSSQHLGSMHQMVQRCVREETADDNGGSHAEYVDRATATDSDGGRYPNDNTIVVGSTVVIGGLTSRPDLNGATGVVVSRKGQRWGVQPEGCDKAVAIKPTCLLPTTTVKTFLSVGYIAFAANSWARAVLTVRYSQKWKNDEGPAQRRGDGSGSGMRSLDACVEMWCRWAMNGANIAVATSATTESADGKVSSFVLEARAEADAVLLGTLAECVARDDGAASRAMELHKKTLVFQQRVLHENHPGIATSMVNLANAYRALGRFKEALTLGENAFEFQRRVLLSDDPDIAKSMNLLVQCFDAVGRNKEALDLGERTLDFRRRVLPEGHSDIATSMETLANTWHKLGNLDAARKLQKSALDFRRRSLAEDHPVSICSMGNISSTYGELGRFEEAHKLKEEVLELSRQVLPEDHPAIATSMVNLAVSNCALGRFEEALKFGLEALDFQQRVLPNDHPDIATSLNNIAYFYCTLDQHESALTLGNKALVLLRRVLPDNHDIISTAMNNIAIALDALGQHDEALAMNEKTLVLLQQKFPGHPRIATSMVNLATSRLHLGQQDAALKLQKDALVLRRRVLPDGHPHIADSMSTLANTYMDLGQHPEAVKLYKEALDFRRRVLPRNHPDIVSSMCSCARMYNALGEYEGALKLGEEALALGRQVLSKDASMLGVCLDTHAITYYHLGRFEIALELGKEALDVLRRVLRRGHDSLESIVCSLGYTYFALDRLEDALEFQRELLELRQEAPRKNFDGIASSMNSIATTLDKLSRWDESEEYYTSALIIYFKHVGDPQHPAMLACKQSLANMRDARRGGTPRRGSAAAPRPASREARGKRPKPNEKCPCGSGKKYKKCHMHSA
jgi:tetratricopeptide (TPR) repeat protein